MRTLSAVRGGVGGGVGGGGRAAGFGDADGSVEGVSGSRGVPGYGLFDTADGQQVALGVVNEQHFWSALCIELGLADLGGLSFSERLLRSEELAGAVTTPSGHATATIWCRVSWRPVSRPPRCSTAPACSPLVPSRASPSGSVGTLDRRRRRLPPSTNTGAKGFAGFARRSRVAGQRSHSRCPVVPVCSRRRGRLRGQSPEA